MAHVLLRQGKFVIWWYFLVLEKTYAHQIAVQILIQKAILIWQIALKFWRDIDLKLTCALPHYLVLSKLFFISEANRLLLTYLTARAATY